MLDSVVDGMLSRFGQWLPNSSFTIPFELFTVYNAVTDIWEAFPIAVRMSLVGVFALATLFCILRMLF